MVLSESMRERARRWHGVSVWRCVVWRCEMPWLEW